MTGQLAFDLELDAEPLLYPYGEDATRCRDCRRKIKGRQAKFCSQGGGPGGHWNLCDDCVTVAAARQRDAAPFYSCGIHKVTYEIGTHTTVCLDNICEWCGEQEPNEFLIRLNHCPEAFIAVRDQMCMKQMTARRREKQAAQ